MKPIRAAFLAFLLIAGGMGRLYAQADAVNTTPDETQITIGEGEETIPLPETERTSLFSFWDFVRMILIFGVVIGVIYLLYRILKKAGGPKTIDGNLLRVISSKNIGGNKYLHLVEVGNQVWLVGAGDSAVSLVAEITEKETLDSIKLQASAESNTGRRSFGDLMMGMFRREPRMNNIGGTNAFSTDFLKKQRERLKKMQ